MRPQITKAENIFAALQLKDARAARLSRRREKQAKVLARQVTKASRIKNRLR